MERKTIFSKDAMKDFHSLSREDRLQISKDITSLPPDVLEPVFPKFPIWGWGRCEVNVLLVADGALSFGVNSFGLSEFITAFRQLEIEANVHIKYNVTVAHRRTEAYLLGIGIPDPLAKTSTFVKNSIENCSFGPISGKNDVNLNSFDQLWLFGIDSSTGALTSGERTVIESFMDNKGGVFSTGDHGALGAALSGQLKRIKSMRLWASTDADVQSDEVSMTGMRRNDTNRPGAGQTVSNQFGNQSDHIPQEIAPRVFAGGLPHPLLSISTSKRASGIIDIMPDHPHEGECAQEKEFTANGTTVRSQIIATSFVLSGSTTAGGGGKTPTLPHCFPSIHVWDGRQANVGRIVVDSTWHHFVNINLNGFNQPEFDTIQQYYMNIAKWISKPKIMLCRYKFVIIDLWLKSNLIEASLNSPDQDLKDITIKDLISIGSLAQEELETKMSPSEAREFMVDSMEMIAPEFAAELDSWKPQEIKSQFPVKWIDEMKMARLAVGVGFIALRDSGLKEKGLNRKNIDRIPEIFAEGLKTGLQMGMRDFEKNLKQFSALVGERGKKRK